MKLRRRRTVEVCSIRLRVKMAGTDDGYPFGVLFEADAEQMHYLAVLGGEGYTGWTELIRDEHLVDEYQASTSTLRAG